MTKTISSNDLDQQTLEATINRLEELGDVSNIDLIDPAVKEALASERKTRAGSIELQTAVAAIFEGKASLRAMIHGALHRAGSGQALDREELWDGLMHGALAAIIRDQIGASLTAEIARTEARVREARASAAPTILLPELHDRVQELVSLTRPLLDRDTSQETRIIQGLVRVAITTAEGSHLNIREQQGPLYITGSDVLSSGLDTGAALVSNAEYADHYVTTEDRANRLGVVPARDDAEGLLRFVCQPEARPWVPTVAQLRRELHRLADLTREANEALLHPVTRPAAYSGRVPTVTTDGVRQKSIWTEGKGGW